MEEMNKEGGAIDVFDCPTRQRPNRMCKCKPVCKWCGFGEHVAIHGAFYGEKPGSKPVDHEYEPISPAPEEN